MAESFTLQVQYKGQTLPFTGELRTLGYIYKIVFEVNGLEVFFERDEERNFRVIVPGDSAKAEKLDRDLLKAIADELEKAVG